MKGFWKRVNRGILLGIIIFLGIIVYLIGDHIQFIQEKEVLTNRLSAYIDELSSLNLEKGMPLNKGRELVFNYWKGRDSKQPDGSLVWSQMLASIERIFNAENDDRAVVNNYIGQLSRVEVKKNGPGAAIVRANYAVTVDLETAGNYLAINGICTVVEEEGISEDLKNAVNPIIRDSKEYYLNVEFVRDGGEWKIIKVYANDIGYAKPSVIEEQGGTAWNWQ